MDFTHVNRSEDFPKHKKTRETENFEKQIQKAFNIYSDTKMIFFHCFFLKSRKRKKIRQNLLLNGKKFWAEQYHFLWNFEIFRDTSTHVLFVYPHFLRLRFNDIRKSTVRTFSPLLEKVFWQNYDRVFQSTNVFKTSNVSPTIFFGKSFHKIWKPLCTGPILSKEQAPKSFKISFLCEVFWKAITK